MDLDQLKQHKRALILGAGAGLLALLWLTRKPVSAGAFSGPTGDTTGTLATGTDAAPAGLPYMGPGSQGSGSWPDWTQAPDGVAAPANNPAGNGTSSADFGGAPGTGDLGGAPSTVDLGPLYAPGIPGPAPGITIDPYSQRAAPPWNTTDTAYWIGTPFDPSSTLVPNEGYSAYLPTTNNPSGIWPMPTAGQSAAQSTSVAATPPSASTDTAYWIGTPFAPTSTLVPNPGYSAYLPTPANPSGIWPMPAN